MKIKEKISNELSKTIPQNEASKISEKIFKLLILIDENNLLSIAKRVENTEYYIIINKEMKGIEIRVYHITINNLLKNKNELILRILLSK